MGPQQLPGGGYLLHVDWVQGDPFASPSRCRVVVPAALAGLPAALVSSRVRRTAVCDFLTRSFGAAVSASGEGVVSGGCVIKEGVLSSFLPPWTKGQPAVLSHHLTTACACRRPIWLQAATSGGRAGGGRARRAAR